MRPAIVKPGCASSFIVDSTNMTQPLSHTVGLKATASSLKSVDAAHQQGNCIEDLRAMRSGSPACKASPLLRKRQLCQRC